MDALVADLESYDPAEDDWEGWTLSNLRPKRTGLPMVVWVQSGEGVPHDVRVKVSMTHGDRISKDNLAVVGVRPEPHLLHGELSRSDLETVVRWIRLNETAIIRHWDGETDGGDLLDELKRL